jgi:Icc-related predicted phosphoesterase
MAAETSFLIAAVADLHLGGAGADIPKMRQLFRAATAQADALVICGDFTCHGRPDELRGLFEARTDLDIPAVAVLGNRDHESDRDDELCDLLTDAGIDVLDGTAVVIGSVGFAGAKGFGGGFEGHGVEAFGERALKRFVEAIHDEVQKLDEALRALQTDTKVALLHYAPIPETLAGEPECIWPFLGCSRFAARIDIRQATVAFHGHAHLGIPSGTTEKGVPVFNVALPVRERDTVDLRIWSVPRRAADALTPAVVNVAPAATRPHTIGTQPIDR